MNIKNPSRKKIGKEKKNARWIKRKNKNKKFGKRERREVKKNQNKREQLIYEISDRHENFFQQPMN